MNIQQSNSEPNYPYLWDGSLKETLEITPIGLNEDIDRCRALTNNYFEVIVKFEKCPNWVTENVWCNNRMIMCRRKKFGPVQFGKGVELLEGTPTKAGGSNGYPAPYFEEGYCILKWVSKGLPILCHIAYKWKITFLSIKTIQTIINE